MSYQFNWVFLACGQYDKITNYQMDWIMTRQSFEQIQI
jgi:hypothetical protein